MCIVNQDGRTVELAQTTRQLQERSSGHSRCIQCSNHLWRIFVVEFPKYQEDANIVINNYAPKQQRQGWNQQQRSTYQGKYPGNYPSKQPSLRDLILEQARINKNISKKLAFNDKVLESINNKMDSFSSTIKDQLSFNKSIEQQLAQLVVALPVATNLEKVNTITTRGGKSTRDPPYPTRIGKTPVVL